MEESKNEQSKISNSLMQGENEDESQIGEDEVLGKFGFK